MDDKSKRLGHESVGKLLFKFSLPAVIGMIVNALYNIVDRIFIGQEVGKEAIAGLTITFPISLIIMAFGMLIGIGSSALVSIRLGQNKKEEAEKILGNAFTSIIIISILVTIFGQIFKEPILRSFGASNVTIDYGIRYITIILYGVILQNVGFGLNNIIRSEGNPMVAMYTMIIGGVLNIILDFLFVKVMRFGIEGAAIATIISQGVNTIWVLSHFTGKRCVLRLKKENLRLDKVIMRGIIAIGMAPFLMQVVSSGVNVLFNKSLAYYGGDTAIAAMGIINSLVMFILMPIFGINQGMQPIVGYNYGAEQYDRVKKAVKLAAIIATIITVSGTLTAEIFPEGVIRIFNKEPELVKIGANAIRKFLIMLPIVGAQIVFSNFFQAIGKPKIAIILSLSRQVLILIPMLLILPRIIGINGIWFSGPVSDAISFMITIIFTIREFKKINKLIEIHNS